MYDDDNDIGRSQKKARLYVSELATNERKEWENAQRSMQQRTKRCINITCWNEKEIKKTVMAIYIAKK